MKGGQKALKFACRHNFTLNNVVVTGMQLCRCCTVRMHASFVVNTLFMKFLLEMEAAAASPFRCKAVIISVSECGCGSSVEYFPVMYMNNFKQQLCYNDNNVTTCWIKVATK